MDGYWLKGSMYETQLLTTVGIDGNIFSRSYAIIDKESKESWVWFLNHLEVDLDVDETCWAFISNKQKGLIEAFNEVLPYVSHRFCARHLHNNFKRVGFHRFALKKAFWVVAKATIKSWVLTCAIKSYNKIKYID